VTDTGSTRARSRTSLPPTQRKEAIKEAKEQLQKTELRRKLQQAIHDADSDYHRKQRWKTIRGVLRYSLALTINLAVLGAIAAGGYFGFKYWQNSSLLGACQERIVRAVNYTLVQKRLTALPSVDFTNASAIRPVPAVLSFESPLSKTSGPDRGGAGTLKGKFDRAAGKIEISLDLFDGTGASGITFAVDPVP
jgi:hypothetical protein